jgi:hypothetical protein
VPDPQVVLQDGLRMPGAGHAARTGSSAVIARRPQRRTGRPEPPCQSAAPRVASRSPARNCALTVFSAESGGAVMSPQEQAGEPAKVLRIAVVMLVVASGAAEAISFTALDHVFAGVMTSNLALLGMAIGHFRGPDVTAAALALAGFGAGAAVVAWVTRGRTGTATCWPGRVMLCLVGEAGLLAVGAGLWAAWGGTPGGTGRDALQCGLAAAMGAQAGGDGRSRASRRAHDLSDRDTRYLHRPRSRQLVRTAERMGASPAWGADRRRRSRDGTAADRPRMGRRTPVHSRHGRRADRLGALSTTRGSRGRSTYGRVTPAPRAPTHLRPGRAGRRRPCPLAAERSEIPLSRPRPGRRPARATAACALMPCRR